MFLSLFFLTINASSSIPLRLFNLHHKKEETKKSVENQFSTSPQMSTTYIKYLIHSCFFFRHKFSDYECKIFGFVYNPRNAFLFPLFFPSSLPSQHLHEMNISLCTHINIRLTDLPMLMY